MADDFGFFSSSESGAPEAAEEDPAAAFLAQQESEIAGIENDEGFGAPALGQPGPASGGESAGWPGHWGTRDSQGVQGRRRLGLQACGREQRACSLPARSRPLARVCVCACVCSRGGPGQWGGTLEIPESPPEPVDLVLPGQEFMVTCHPQASSTTAWLWNPAQPSPGRGSLSFPPACLGLPAELGRCGHYSRPLCP